MACPIHDVIQQKTRQQFLAAGRRFLSNGRVGSRSLRREVAQGSGGARRDRTDDLLLAKQALSQLSYGPGRGQVSGDKRQDVLTPDF